MLDFVAQGLRGLRDCHQVAGQVSAAVAYNLLSITPQNQSDVAACLAKLDLPLLQSNSGENGVTKVS